MNASDSGAGRGRLSAAGARAPWFALLALGLALPLALWWLRAAGQTPDGLSYALDVRRGTGLWHPHHLLYAPAASALHRGLGLAPLTACLVVNLASLPWLAWAALGIARRLLSDARAAWAAVALLLGARGVLFYATHAETYLPALAWTAVTLRLALAERPRAAPVAFALALAIGFHQTNVLLLPPLLLLAGGAASRRPLARAAGAAALLVGAGYLLAWRHDGAGAPFIAYLTTYARAAVPAWGRWDHFGPGGVLALGRSQAQNLVPAPALFAVPLLLVVLALAGWHARRVRGDDAQAGARRFALAMLVLWYAFFLWWLPGDADFFLAPVLPLWVLALLWWRDRRCPGGFAAPAALAGLIAAVNVAVTVLPMHRDAGPEHRAALALDATTPRDATLVTGYGLQQELLYYSGRADVREGTELCAAMGAGFDALFPGRGDEPAVVVEAALLGDLLAERVPGGANCLARLLGLDEAAGRCRAYARRLDGGLAIFATWRPAPARAELLRELALLPPREPTP